ncbi:alpha-(1-_6)-mannopyranosyltransferase A [Corynebacterium alimapuense]|uniref:Alpha-(1->6)-mannopyranosyltransferase A n=1 Tax=Corynebacterium alimapuense TaxID=1576874 RepID=A0A3M8K9D6_9CORY|nr:alpha-(1->6)-mannopyranosyltransferase A [Corynebacterium alimapuense]RNE49499.1 alpha-(1->6)-mannopyranosyltransferase A [Corynebacterium alimapuense]
MNLTVSRLPHAITLGAVGSFLILLGSFGGGATRNRDGVLEATGLDFLAYGHGAGISNIVLWLGMMLLLAGWVLFGHRHIIGTSGSPADTGVEKRAQLVQKALWVWIAPLVLAAPILSRDVYSYLMQGAMLRDGFDPYTQGAAVNPGPYLLEVSHDWRNTTTPYGPLHLWIGEGITRLVGDSVTAGVIVYKLISIAGFGAIAWSVPKIARRLGGNPALALWLGVANPVMILHMIGGMHNEAVMVGLVSLGLLAALHEKFLMGIALIAVAVSLKATAAIALPFVVWMAVHHYAGATATRGRQVIVFIISGAVTVAETLAVVATVTWASGASWGWLSEISGNSKVINPLALPSFLAGIVTPFMQLFDEQYNYNVPLQFFRSLSMLLMLIGLVIIWWLFRGDNRRAIMGTAAAYQVAFIFNSVTLPWYYASVISLLGTFSPPRWVLRLSTGASIMVTLAFTGSGNHQLYNAWWMAWAIVSAWLLTDFIYRDGALGRKLVAPRSPLLEPDAPLHAPADHATPPPVDRAANRPQ